ncbi:transporter [uncultured Clostridium sp.]|uniref:YkvI family membrane protein n=1 Tax=uncultured Clostridium sp. TaxID=59620 RepID=UPI0028EDD888|nr:transporter [uncultured Clostridium sp.]
MFKNIKLVFQIAAVFIGTIVGAGLASGQEITQFFSTYGYKSFIGIFICCIIYILSGYIIVDLSIKYRLNSYNELIQLVSPGLLGKVTDFITTLFLISGSAIILAGSGALIHQYFNLNKWVGIILMSIMAMFILFKDTKGLIQINSLIVPSLTIVIITLFILYVFFHDNTSFSYVKTLTTHKKNWFLSSLLYCSFNVLSASGVMVPLAKEIPKKRYMFTGIALGAICLTVLSLIINLLLMLNMPYIFEYEIPLLYVANRFGKALQFLLLTIIWFEMFSTEVSDIYSVSKTLEQTFKISYKKGCFLVMCIAIPLSQIGFVKLITFLYPAFGLISLIFLIQCCLFYFKK